MTQEETEEVDSVPGLSFGHSSNGILQSSYSTPAAANIRRIASARPVSGK